MMALKVFVFSIVLMTSFNTLGDCHGILRRLLQVSSSSSSKTSVEVPPPVDSGIIEGETDETRRRWHLRQLDLFLPKSTEEPSQKLGAENKTSSSASRKKLSAPASNLEPVSASHRRFPFFETSAIAPRMLHTPPRFAIPPLASDFIKEGDSGTSRGRFGAHRSIDNFPPLLNQPGQEYLDAINRRTVWPGFTTTTTTYRPITNVPTVVSPTVSSTSSTLATTSKPATTFDYKWLSVTTQPTSKLKLEEPSPPLVLTIKYNDTTIGTAFSLSEDLTDAHLSMEMFTSPIGNVTIHPTTNQMSTTGSTVSTTTTGTTTTTNAPTLMMSPATVLSTSTVAVTQQATSEVTTAIPVTSTNQSTSNVTAKREEIPEVNQTKVEIINVQPQDVVQDQNFTTTTVTHEFLVTIKGLAPQLNEKMETSTTYLSTMAQTATTTVQTTTIPTSTTVQTTTIPTTTTVQTTPITTKETTVNNKPTTKPPSLPNSVSIPPLVRRRIPNFRSNPRQTLRPQLTSPSKATTTTLPILLIEEDEVEEDYYVPTLPPMEPTSTKRQHVIIVPSIDDGFDAVFDEDHMDESSMAEAEDDSLEPTSLSDEQRLIPEGAKDAIVISIVIGGCAVVFFATVMIVCMLRNRRTVYRAPDSSASSSNSSSPFQTKLG